MNSGLTPPARPPFLGLLNQIVIEAFNFQDELNKQLVSLIQDMGLQLPNTPGEIVTTPPPTSPLDNAMEYLYGLARLQRSNSRLIQALRQQLIG